MGAAEWRQTIYVSDEDRKLMDRIRRDAEHEDRSISNLIFRIIRDYYRRVDRKK